MKTTAFSAALLLLAFCAKGAADPSTLSPVSAASAEPQDADSKFQQARALLHGDGVEKNPQKAFDLMKAAAEQGHAEAMGGVGYFYSLGLVVAKDDRLAAEWFRKGADKGSAKAQFNLGKILLAGGAAEGIQWMKKAADQGLSEAGLAYGSILYFGDHGVAKDQEKAAPYLKIAADAGDPEAQNFYGTLCELGLGVPQDSNEARRWLHKAALQGFVKAQSNLGASLGPQVEDGETRIEALAWLIIASGQGEVTAEKLLADTVPGLKSEDLDAAKIRVAELRKTIRLRRP